MPENFGLALTMLAKAACNCSRAYCASGQFCACPDSPSFKWRGCTSVFIKSPMVITTGTALGGGPGGVGDAVCEWPMPVLPNSASVANSKIRSFIVHSPRLHADGTDHRAHDHHD